MVMSSMTSRDPLRAGGIALAHHRLRSLTAFLVIIIIINYKHMILVVQSQQTCFVALISLNML